MCDWGLYLLFGAHFFCYLYGGASMCFGLFGVCVCILLGYVLCFVCVYCCVLLWYMTRIYVLWYMRMCIGSDFVLGRCMSDCECVSICECVCLCFICVSSVCGVKVCFMCVCVCVCVSAYKDWQPSNEIYCTIWFDLLLFILFYFTLFYFILFYFILF